MDNENSREDEYIRNTYLQMPKNPNIRIGREYQASIPEVNRHIKVKTKNNKKGYKVMNETEEISKPSKRKKYQ